MTIGNSIRQLLEERKKVIFPGFGNLEIKEAGSGVSASGKRIDPPGPSIKFDGSFSKDDNLLATTLAEESGLDLEEARQQILELVDAIRFALDKGEPYYLENAGTFSRDDDGKVHFQPEKGWVVDPGQYGLESMDLLELEDLPEEKEPGKPAEPETIEAAVDAKETAPAGKTEKTVQHEPWKTEKPHRKTNTWRILWAVAGVLIVVLIVLILVPSDKLNLFGDREGTEQQMPGNEAIGDSEITDPPPAENLQAGEAEAIPEKVVDQAIEVEPNKYFLIAGSFKHLGNASELQDQLIARGYKAEVLVTENRMYRVSAASYADQMDAERGLSRIKLVPGLEACWLLSNE